MTRNLAYPVFRQPSAVTFGTGSVRTLATPEVINRSVFLVSANAAVHEKLRTAFQRHGVDWDALPMLRKPAGEPTRETVSHGSEWLIQQRADRIVAIGGGSVLDWARLAAALANGWLELDSGRIAGQLSSRPEWVLVPTTCGTGAEAAAVAVYMVGRRKIGVFCPAFVADRVVLDGQFLSLLDDGSLCAFLSDALSHAVESFVSIVPNALAKEAALSTLSLILTHHGAPASTSRAQHLMEAGYLGGVAAWHNPRVDFVRELDAVRKFLRDGQFRVVVIGGVALGASGNPRMTSIWTSPPRRRPKKP